MVLNTNNWDWRIYCGNRKCDFSIELKKENLQNYFDTKFGKQIYETSKQYDINIFSELYEEMMCGKCETFPLHIINNKHDLILDPENIVTCAECEKPILLTRLKIKKNTKICTPCAKEMEKSTAEKLKFITTKPCLNLPLYLKEWKNVKNVEATQLQDILFQINNGL